MIDVSIVLITYNDAARLPRALASLQRQTLRNLEIIVVDDASTDATQGLVLEAAASDSRIRYVRLAENSGGCSAPRNRGMSEAVGTWLMFCDSDDEFDRHAAKNLLRAVEAADADLGCGVAERIDVRTRKVKRWKEELHERGVLASISERPDLIADTVSVNKIYRHEWLVDSGMTFPEGILYEDQLFTMKAYAEARRIAVISETVYLWYVDKAGSELSITQRRNEIRNARSRVEVNRLIDEYLQAHGDPDLARVNAQKFLAHDLYLYLAAMLEMDDADATAIADVLRPYVESVDLAQAAAQRPALRVATYHLLVGDLAGLRRAMRFIRWSAVVDAPVVVRPTGVFWGCAYLDGGPSFQGLGPEWWLDVTSLHLDRFQVSQRRWCHRLDVLAAGGRRLSVAGRTTDAFGDFGRASAVEFVLVLGGQVVASMPLALERGTADDSSEVAPEWAWHSTGQRLAAVGDEFEDLSRGHFALRVTIDGVSNVIAVRAPERAVPRVMLPGANPALGLRAYPGDHGVVRWQAGRNTRS
ncbi:MAG: glycosyltransferase, partial [Actinobacteria bacterium]|nr:glycosyltransferase [Actinomycetota bacterium]